MSKGTQLRKKKSINGKRQKKQKKKKSHEQLKIGSDFEAKKELPARLFNEELSGFC